MKLVYDILQCYKYRDKKPKKFQFVGNKVYIYYEQVNNKITCEACGFNNLIFEKNVSIKLRDIPLVTKEKHYYVDLIIERDSYICKAKVCGHVGVVNPNFKCKDHMITKRLEQRILDDLKANRTALDIMKDYGVNQNLVTQFKYHRLGSGYGAT